MQQNQIAKFILQQLKANREIFARLFQKTTPEMVQWRLKADQWNMLEIVGHLIDEEIEDFRLRTKWTIERPNTSPPPIDPVGWVLSRAYSQRDFQSQVDTFNLEREKSITWLASLDLESIQWNSGYAHPKLGHLDAWHYFTNWLAHDHHHIRQINRLHYGYLREIVEKDLYYAGNHLVFQ